MPEHPPPRTPTDARDRLTQVLAARRVLLVVDDVWSDAAAQALRVTGPQGRILYTTRDPQVLAAVRARPHLVDVLSPDTSRALAAGILDIAPENVIVQYTPYANSDTNDQFGVPIREAQTVGEGEALVLTGGVAYTARWVKPAANAPTQYLDAAGAPIRLTPGRTWVELPEPGTTGILP